MTNYKRSKTKKDLKTQNRDDIKFLKNNISFVLNLFENLGLISQKKDKKGRIHMVLMPSKCIKLRDMLKTEEELNAEKELEKDVSN